MRIFGLLPVSTINKNKIKIQPYSKTKAVTFDEQDTPKSSIQKTSITINSAECLSTVNVTDRAGQYHSSVLLNNESDRMGDISNQKSFDEYVGSISAERQKNLHNNSISVNSPTEIAIVYHHNNHSNASKSKGDILEMISTNVDKTKTLICLDYESSSCITPISKKTIEIPTKVSDNNHFDETNDNNCITLKPIADSLILKLLNDPHLSHLLYGLEIKAMAKIIESSLLRLRTSKHNKNTTNSTKDTETDKIFINLLHNIIKEERSKLETTDKNIDNTNLTNSFIYSQDEVSNNDSKIYNCESKKNMSVRKLYDMLMDDDTSYDLQNHHHQYESVCFNCDPIYEEINEKPPPLPINPPPILNNLPDKQQYKSMFLGATKYDILSYLVDAKERIKSPSEESYSFKFLRRAHLDDSSTFKKKPEDTIKIIDITEIPHDIDRETKTFSNEKCMTSIERNDSGVGSECSRTKYQPSNILDSKKISPIHLCEDCCKYFYPYIKRFK